MKFNCSIFFFLGALLILIGCENKEFKKKVIDTNGKYQELDSSNSLSELIDLDSANFHNAIISLEKIQFFISGKDSMLVTSDPTDLIELNSIMYSFHNPFSNSDSGLVRYKRVVQLRKYSVIRRDGKSGNRPSASIIQLTFDNNKIAEEWFGFLSNSSENNFKISKPKTELWLNKKNVYFIQTYHTPQRDYIDLIKSTLIGNLKG